MTAPDAAQHRGWRWDDATGRRIGRLIAAASIGQAVFGVLLLAAIDRSNFLIEAYVAPNAILAIAFGVLGWFVFPAQPRNGAVWALSGAGFFGGLFAASAALGTLLARRAIPDFSLASATDITLAELPLEAAIAISPGAWAWLPAIGLVLTLGLLLFPDGKLPSRRWRWLAWFSVAVIAAGSASLAWLFRPTSTLSTDLSEDELPGVLGSVVSEGIFLMIVAAFLSIVSLFVRYRRSTNETRTQLRWIAWGATSLSGTLIVSAIVEDTMAQGGRLSDYFFIVGEGLLIAAFFIAITKYRLYDIDIIVNKTVTYLGLAASITLLYAAVVVGPLLVIGLPDEGGPGLALPIAATAVVAVLFEPIRSRMQRWANRVVYGERATPHEVLSQVTARLAERGRGGTSDLARLLAEGTSADEAVVWLRIGKRLQPEGAWPAGRTSEITPTATADIPNDDFNASIVVRHGDDVLGAVSIHKPSNDPITPADRDLLSDVAAGAGLMLRNISLNRQLEERANQVRDSRRRLIAAQDAERHRLERNLHDGAQQQVVALKVKLGLAKTIAEREDALDVASQVGALAEETQEAVDAMRAVAHGIYPPLLESEGLEPALAAFQRSAAGSVTIDSTGIDRYGRLIEETVYFCVLEATQRARMSGAHAVRIGLRAESHRCLVIDIDHDGRTTRDDLAAISDRVEAFGGTTVIADLAGVGTRITSEVPLTELALEPVS